MLGQSFQALSGSLRLKYAAGCDIYHSVLSELQMSAKLTPLEPIPNACQRPLWVGSGRLSTSASGRWRSLATIRFWPIGALLEWQLRESGWRRQTRRLAILLSDGHRHVH